MCQHTLMQFYSEEIHKLINHMLLKCILSYRHKMCWITQAENHNTENISVWCSWTPSFPPSMRHLINHEWHNTQFETLEHMEKQHIWLVWEWGKKWEHTQEESNYMRKDKPLWRSGISAFLLSTDKGLKEREIKTRAISLHKSLLDERISSC